jgi:phosphoribosylanthranilate isomerase
MKTKLDIFLKICMGLNAELDLIPCLCGSLGLQQRIGKDLRPDDIDMLVPARFIADRWNELSGLAAGLGYELIDPREHTFHDGEAKISFAKMDLDTFAGIPSEKIPQIETEGARYLLPTLEQFLRIYEASSKDGYRTGKQGKKDFEKIKMIKIEIADRQAGVRFGKKAER